MFKFMKLVFLFLLFPISNFVYSSDINITVKGKVVAKACTVITDSVHLDFGDNPTRFFRTRGTATNSASFKLKLTDCPIGTTSVQADFDGPRSGKYFISKGTAKNMNYYLKDDREPSSSNDKPILSMVVDVDKSSRTAVFPLRAAFFTLDGRATSGSLSGTVNVTYSYK